MFTALLFVVTALQFGVSKSEFYATHRPYIRIRHIDLGIHEGEDFTSVQYHIANTGGTDAIVVATSERLWERDADDPLPGVPPYDKPTTRKERLKPGFSIVSRHILSAESAEQIDFLQGFHKAKKKMGDTFLSIPNNIYFLGYIDYVDGLKRQRRTAFLYHVDLESGRLKPIADPEYSYED